MIKPEERFLVDGRGYFGSSEDPTTIVHSTIWDWDQLCTIKVKGTAKLFPPDEDNESSTLIQVADYLAPEVRAITLDDNGLLREVSTDPKEDDAIFIAYVPFSTIKSFYPDSQVVRYSQLQELDRLGPGVDLSSYNNGLQKPQKVAFKFNPLGGSPRRLQMAWDEMNVLQSLPPHPNLLSLDRLVIEDKESRVVGFTTKYIPDGTFDDVTRPLRLEWIQQLTQLVDFLNLDLGIMHQDIAPRNLLVDPETQKILLFDFDWVAHGNTNLLDGRDDVNGVVVTLYELITGDTHFTSIPHWDRDMNMVLNSEWTCNRELDHDVSVFRQHLDQWLATRMSGGKVDLDRYLNAPNQLTWPSPPELSDYDVPYEVGRTAEGEGYFTKGPRTVRAALDLGQYVFNWRRPPQSRMITTR